MSKAYKEICPCKCCEERNIECHSICKRYNEWCKNGIEIEKPPFIHTIKFYKKNKRR